MSKSILKAYDESECLEAVLNASFKTEKEEEMIRKLIGSYFSMIRHMKDTSLLDIFEYEEKVTNLMTAQLGFLTNENCNLKTEINKLRKEIGKSKKYKEKGE